MRQRSRRLATMLSQKSITMTVPTSTSIETEPTEEQSKQKRYCNCKDNSTLSTTGLMIACDNDKCPTEWFHPECVGITEAEMNKIAIANWYCPECRPKFPIESVRKVGNRSRNTRSPGK